MLWYLCKLLESTINLVFRDLYNLDYTNLSWTKILVGALSCIALIIGLYWALKYLSNYLISGFDQILNWRHLGILNGASVLINSINEIKFCLSAAIALIFSFTLIFNNYISNRPRARPNPLIEIVFDGDFDFDFGFPAPHVDLRADLNKNDGQNVHNGTVTKHILECLRKLSDWHTKIPNQIKPSLDVYREIRTYLRSSQNPKSLNALDVLDHIHNFNDLHSASGLREMDILGLIWNRIQDPCNMTTRTDLQEALLLQLDDCKPNGVMMCLTGRICRIVQSLECLDAEQIVDIKPLWAVKDQISTYFGRYTDKLLKLAPPDVYEAYMAEDPTPEQSLKVEAFNQCLKRNLNRKFDLLYIKTGILTQRQIDELAEDYFNHIN